MRLPGFATTPSNLLVALYFAKLGFENGADHQMMTARLSSDQRTMNEMYGDDIKAVVVETLAEQQRLRHNDIDDVVS
jgi:hypothetical protein